jgi:hypothetical protein
VEVISKVIAILVTAMFHRTPPTSWEFKAYIHKRMQYFLFPFSDLIENNLRYKVKKEKSKATL